MKKNIIIKIYIALSIILLTTGIVFIVGDYIKYNPISTSAPFEVNIIIRAIEFIIPAIFCYIISYIIKKRK